MLLYIFPIDQQQEDNFQKKQKRFNEGSEFFPFVVKQPSDRVFLQFCYCLITYDEWKEFLIKSDRKQGVKNYTN